MRRVTTCSRHVACFSSGCSVFFFSSRRRHTRCSRDWSSDVCSSDLRAAPRGPVAGRRALLEERRGDREDALCRDHRRSGAGGGVQNAAGGGRGDRGSGGGGRAAPHPGGARKPWGPRERGGGGGGVGQ